MEFGSLKCIHGERWELVPVLSKSLLVEHQAKSLKLGFDPVLQTL
jgi:hypothetical protein